MSTTIPLFPLGTVIFPGMTAPLHIFEDRYRQLMSDHGDDPHPFAIGLIRPPMGPDDDVPSHYVATACRITHKVHRSDDRWDILVEGVRRIRVDSIDRTHPYDVAIAEWLPDYVGDGSEAVRLRDLCAFHFERYATAMHRISGKRLLPTEISAEPVTASWELASHLPLHTWERQRLLELETGESRLREMSRLIERELTLLIRAGIAGTVLNHPGGRFSLN